MCTLYVLMVPWVLIQKMYFYLQPLSSMPVLEKNGRDCEQLEHEDDTENEDDSSPAQKRPNPVQQWSRPTSRSKSGVGQRSRSLTRPTSINKLTGEVSIVILKSIRLLYGNNDRQHLQNIDGGLYVLLNYTLHCTFSIGLNDQHG